MHAPDGALSVRRSVPVGTAARDEPEEISERSDPLDVFANVTRMPDLDAIEPQRDECFESRTPAFVSRMSPHSDCSRGMCQRNCVRYFETCLGDVTRLARRKVSVERFARITHVSTANKCARNMRPAHCTTRSLLHHDFHRYVDSLSPQSFHDSARTLFTVSTKYRETLLDVIRPRNVKREKMNFLRPVVCAQLDSMYNANAERGCSGFGFSESVESVVISERYRSQARASRCGDDCRWCKRSVRRGRVHVQVDLSGRPLGLP
jgi:hypothetical protein